MEDSNLLRAVAESVQQAIECRVCQRTVRIPFKQCSRGHIACSKCVLGLQHCPTCGDGELTENPEEELTLLSELPKLCCYSKEGCKAILYKYNHGDDHETLCHYRPASCREPGCKEVVPLIKLVEHYELKHEEHVMKSEGWYKNGLTIKACLNTNAKGVICTLVHIPIYEYYWIVTRNNHEEKQIEFRVLGIRNDECFDDHLLRISIGDGRPYLYSYTFHPLEVDALTDLKTEENDHFDDQRCMRVPYEAVKRLADDKGELKLTVTYFYY